MSAPVLSVVDYDAWGKGYMPPGEHRLIHALSYEGARVMASESDCSGKGSGWWLVVQGDAIDAESTFEVMMFIAERKLRRIRGERIAKMVGRLAVSCLINEAAAPAETAVSSNSEGVCASAVTVYSGVDNPPPESDGGPASAPAGVDDQATTKKKARESA